MSKEERKFRNTSKAMGFPGGSANKESACNAGDLGSILGLKYSDFISDFSFSNDTHAICLLVIKYQFELESSHF